MIDIYKYIIPLALYAAICSCSKEPSSNNGGDEITFSVQMADESGTKAAGQYLDDNLDQLAQFKVTGYDLSNKDIDARIVYKTGSLWKFNDNPKAWISGHTRTFWADANMPSWASLSSSSASSATFNVTTIPSTADAQWDPLIGYYSGPGNNGNAVITFYHPFTAITFKTGNLGTPQVIKSINSVKLTGVYNKGTATVTGGSSLTYSWSGTTTSYVTGPFTSGQSTKPFILIPQNLESSAITIEVTATLKADDSTKTMNLTLNTGEWKPGYHYTYTLDYIPYHEMDGSLKVTLTDWVYVKSQSGKDYFDANFDE